MATISFDFCYTKSVPESMVEKQVDTMTCLVMCDSATGYLYAVPLRSKNPWSLMVRELLGFAGILGHSELVFMCDNEPALLQLQRMVVNARLSLGLPTRKTNPPDVQPELEDKGDKPKYSNPIGIFDDDDEPADGQPASLAGQPSAPMASSTAASAAAAGSDDPQTPDVFAAAPTTPRQSPTTRRHDVEAEEHDAKRARVETTAKTQRIERISAEYSSMVRMVKFGEETFHTMDEYEHDLQLDDHNNVDAWMEEEKEDLPMTDMPPKPWSNFPADRCPPAPDASIDRIADGVELSRLCGMNVLVEGNVDGVDASSSTLTSRFVYDWRLKERVMPDGTTTKCWLRRSRLVAREYSFWEKRSDTYAPATSTHLLNLLPMMYLQSLANVSDDTNNASEPLCLATLDVKDAFLISNGGSTITNVGDPSWSNLNCP